MLNNCRRARGAGYRQSNRKGCLRGTRETVLEEIELWTRDLKQSPVFWLNGLAGTGKSTIAQTIAERAFASGLLGASFFCSRDFQDRSDLHFIFPTLAFQLAHKYPNFRSHLVSLLLLDPDIVDESLYGQMERLIVEPLRSANISTVVVIDALDECKDEEPSSAILSVLGRFVEKIPSVKFFITGRPEPWIKTGFRLPLLVDETNVFVLHDVRPHLVNNDIRLYLKHKLSELAQRCQLGSWPSDEHIELLCHRAGGLFVYAVATAKFLDSNIHLPKQRLDMIASLPECTVPEGKTCFKPNTTLDSLYTSILEMAFHEGDPEADSKIRSTIGTVVLLVNPLPVSGIAELVGLDPEEVRLFLKLVQSLLILDGNSNLPIKPFHKSFPDFITNSSRCLNVRFYILPGSLHLNLATNCLRLMNDSLEQNLLLLPNYALNSEVKDMPMRIKDHVSIALQYACQFWHNHLTEARGDVTDAVFHLHIFLEDKFLAWLEIASALGAARGAVVALEKLIPWLQEVCFGSLHSTINANRYYDITQVARDNQLLDMARDYFHFVTKFFDVISASAAHIYHSALELSPLSSIVRRLYYHQRPIPFPRVVAGAQDSWDQSITHSNEDYIDESCTWSPCSQFFATLTQDNVKIWDPLTFELLSTLTSSGDCLNGELAYSPDGCSLACLSDTALIIWDIQTGGVAQRTKCSNTHYTSLLWSLDGETIGLMRMEGRFPALCMYCVASGTMQSLGCLPSSGSPHFWVHNNTFRIMTITWEDGILTADTFEAGSTFAKVKSCSIQPGIIRIYSFFPSMNRVSISTHGELVILDIQNLRCLLSETGEFYSHCFSSDGGLFAASTKGADTVRVWKCASNYYTPWKEFLCQDICSSIPPLLQFSPNFSSILGHFSGILRVWHLSDHHSTPPNNHELLTTISHNYIATANKGHHTITITNPLLPTPSQFINTDMEIQALVLTGNILLVVGSEMIVAWCLTEEGEVAGVLGHQQADQSSRVWTLPRPSEPMFTVKGQIGAIKDESLIPHIYHTGTGEVLQPIQAPPLTSYYWSDLKCMWRGWPYLKLHSFSRYHTFHSKAGSRDTDTTVQEGWVRDPEGKHRLWLPFKWRTCQGHSGPSLINAPSERLYTVRLSQRPGN